MDEFARRPDGTKIHKQTAVDLIDALVDTFRRESVYVQAEIERAILKDKNPVDVTIRLLEESKSMIEAAFGAEAVVDRINNEDGS